MKVKIRTNLSCLNQQQQKQKKTPLELYKLKVMQGFLWQPRALCLEVKANKFKSTIKH